MGSDTSEEDEREAASGSARRNSRFKSRRSILESSDLKEGLNEMICAKRLNPQWIYMGTVHLYCSRYPTVPYGTTKVR